RQRAPQDLLLVGLTAVERRGDRDADGELAIDLEVGREPPAAVRLAVAIAEVSGRGQRGQGLDHAAVDGGQHPADILLPDATGRRASAQSSEMIASSRSGSRIATASDKEPKEVREHPTLRRTCSSRLACCRARKERRTGLRRTTRTRAPSWSKGSLRLPAL